ncbi:hypothetical protein O6P43_028103 [Quillaja saponaria]|uniref:Uncharacterized protein n=1 Tax=Quillaja saponaria TaxID=32244 RepID=A0AAD7KXA8_QUISA|nr:hypothetical protein O6P43_028103 [Quillaja saponaria]
MNKRVLGFTLLLLGAGVAGYTYQKRRQKRKQDKRWRWVRELLEEEKIQSKRGLEEKQDEGNRIAGGHSSQTQIQSI